MRTSRPRPTAAGSTGEATTEQESRCSQTRLCQSLAVASSFANDGPAAGSRAARRSQGGEPSAYWSEWRWAFRALRETAMVASRSPSKLGAAAAGWEIVPLVRRRSECARAATTAAEVGPTLLPHSSPVNTDRLGQAARRAAREEIRGGLSGDSTRNHERTPPPPPPPPHRR